MPPRRCLPEPWPNVMLETAGSRVARSIGVWVCCTGKGLAGAAEDVPGKGLAGEKLLRPSALCGLGLGVALAASSFGFTSVHLP